MSAGVNGGESVYCASSPNNITHHADAPEADHVPAGHIVHIVPAKALNDWYVPAAQVKHEPPDKYWPALHE